MEWTEENIETLRKLWAQGLSASEIAKIMGITKNAVVGKVHRLCLTARQSPIKNKEVAEPEIKPIIEIVPQPIEEKKPVEEVKPIVEKRYKKGPNNVKLMELDSHTCRWPIGDPRDEDFCFCGKKVRSGKTYCDEHSAIAYVKIQRK
ncbi:MAG: global cell cycle regulator GcrA-like protein [Alphaproteobacteria bacterium]|nr:global cell cycle regulator GcrA-like protein [Alphaproteobacteria bacterium]